MVSGTKILSYKAKQSNVITFLTTKVFLFGFPGKCFPINKSIIIIHIICAVLSVYELFSYFTLLLGIITF
jgi:hypothetical protein